MKTQTKVFYIILFILAVVAQVLSIVTYIDCIRVMLSNSLAALAAITLLPLFFIGTFVIFILSVILTIIYKTTAKNYVNSEEKPPAILKILNVLSWLFVVINIILFICLNIIF